MTAEINPRVRWVQDRPYPLVLISVAIIYLAAAALGLQFTFDASRISPVWPAAGIAFAAVYLLGYRIWPGIAAAAFLASAMAYAFDGAAVPDLLLASFGAALAGTLQALLAVYLLRRLVAAFNPFDRVLDVFKYLLSVGLAGNAAGATIGVAAVALAGLTAWSEYSSLWLIWWLAVMASNLVLGSFLVVWLIEPPIGRQPRRLLEAVLSLAAFIATILIIFAGSSSTGESSPLLGALIFPFLFSFIWASVRFGHRGASMALLAMWVLYVAAIVNGLPSQASRSQEDSLFLAEFYMSTIAALTLIPSAMTRERRDSQNRLRLAKEDIERGNLELSKANLELQRENRERQLAQADLERSNAELQQFAYVASHDLQEPLRMVASFVQLLEQGYGGQLDENAREYIAFAEEGATRMQRMIDDLLAYSRVGTRGQTFDLCDLNAALKQAQSDLKISMEKSQAEVTQDPLPAIKADRLQITQVFLNLLANAIKFCGEEPPRIHVSARSVEGAWEISVRDNGIGIEPRHFERIFVIFQRLNKRRDYPGTGIGLALCKRIVERHGGNIWVESQPGQGSTFYFTIPNREG